MNQLESSKTYTEQKFHNIDTPQAKLSESEFVKCSFSECDLSGSLIEKTVFEECTFTNCNLSTAKFNETRFVQCTFQKCRLMGIDWSLLRSGVGLQLEIERSDLIYSIFTKVDFSNSQIIHCKVHEADFTEAVAKKVNFHNSDLFKSIFIRTDLREADFREALNYLFDPAANKINGALFLKDDAVNLLKAFGAKVV